MSKGGYFPNAERWGRKSGWNDPVTKVIRVPESIADRVIDIAHKLDRGIVLDSVTETKNQEIDSVTEAKDKQIAELAQIRDNLEQVKITLQEALKLKANAGGAIKAEIRKALELLGDRPASSADQMPVDDGDR